MIYSSLNIDNLPSQLHPTTLNQSTRENARNLKKTTDKKSVQQNDSIEYKNVLVPSEHPSLKSLRFLSQLVRKPIETFIESLSRGRASSLNVPVALAQRVKAELVCNIRCIHCIRQILEGKKRVILIHVICCAISATPACLQRQEAQHP